MFVKLFQVSADEGIKLFQIRACVISARKAKHLDVTTMFAYCHANTPLGQSESAFFYL